MAPALKPSTAATLRSYIEGATTGSKPTFPGVIFHVTDARGTPLFSHASQGRTPDTLWISQSLGKIIGAIAFMQLVDQGLATLDDASLIEKWLPELADKKVLVGSKESNGETVRVYEDRKGDVTPRMLLNHTNGTGQSFFNEEVRDILGESVSTVNEGTEYFDTLLQSPLLWQPGTKTNYGQGLDWLSVLIERLTGQSLEHVLREGIFEKLGIEKTGFKGEWGGRVVAGEGVDFWPASLRTEDGFVTLPGFAEKKVERDDAWPKGKHHAQSVSTGLVSSSAELARIFSILLPQNAGVDPVSGTRILSAASAAEFVNMRHPEKIRNDLRNLLTAHFAFLPYDLQRVDPAGYFSLGCAVQGEERVLEDGRRGRSKNSIYWYGASNSAYWIDGEKELVVIATGNFFPFNDAKWVEFMAGLEGLLYEGLEM